jgi:hypothetical protein
VNPMSASVHEQVSRFRACLPRLLKYPRRIFGEEPREVFVADWLTSRKSGRM